MASNSGDVRAHDGEIGEHDRNRLIPPAAATAAAPVHRLTDHQSDDDRNQSELIAGDRENRVVEDAPRAPRARRPPRRAGRA